MHGDSFHHVVEWEHTSCCRSLTCPNVDSQKLVYPAGPLPALCSNPGSSFCACLCRRKVQCVRLLRSWVGCGWGGWGGGQWIELLLVCLLGVSVLKLSFTQGVSSLPKEVVAPNSGPCRGGHAPPEHHPPPPPPKPNPTETKTKANPNPPPHPLRGNTHASSNFCRGNPLAERFLRGDGEGVVQETGCCTLTDTDMLVLSAPEQVEPIGRQRPLQQFAQWLNTDHPRRNRALRKQNTSSLHDVKFSPE